MVSRPQDHSKSRASFAVAGAVPVNTRIDASPPAALAAPRRASPWPARLDLLQSGSGLALGVFMWVHMFFVSSILLGSDAMWTVARFFEGYFIFGKAFGIHGQCNDFCSEHVKKGYFGAYIRNFSPMRLIVIIFSAGGKNEYRMAGIS